MILLWYFLRWLCNAQTLLVKCVIDFLQILLHQQQKIIISEMSQSKRINRKITLNTSLEQESKKLFNLPNFSVSDYHQKLNDLLNKVSIQNRYTSRITECNIKNIESLEKAQNELTRIQQQKKMEELMQSQFKNSISEVLKRLNRAQKQLSDMTAQYFISLKEIKQLKRQLMHFQQANLKLEKDLFQIKRQKCMQVSVAKQEIEHQLLEFNVIDYLSNSNNLSSLLYQYCLDRHKSRNYHQFFQNLESQIERRSKLVEEIKSVTDSKVQPSTAIKNHRYIDLQNSKIKLKPLSYHLSGKRLLQRFKTDHH